MPVFDAMLTEIVPLPVPLFRPVIAIHGALLLADHVQVGSALTEISSLEPSAETLIICGVTEFEHSTDSAAA
jgi:hypothetical protein